MAKNRITKKVPKDFDELVSKMELVEDEVPPPPGMEAPRGGERPKVMVPRWAKELREKSIPSGHNSFKLTFKSVDEWIDFNKRLDAIHIKGVDILSVMNGKEMFNAKDQEELNEIVGSWVESLHVGTPFSLYTLNGNFYSVSLDEYKLYERGGYNITLKISKRE